MINTSSAQAPLWRPLRGSRSFSFLPQQERGRAPARPLIFLKKTSGGHAYQRILIIFALNAGRTARLPSSRNRRELTYLLLPLYSNPARLQYKGSASGAPREKICRKSEIQFLFVDRAAGQVDAQLAVDVLVHRGKDDRGVGLCPPQV